MSAEVDVLLGTPDTCAYSVYHFNLFPDFGDGADELRRALLALVGMLRPGQTVDVTCNGGRWTYVVPRDARVRARHGLPRLGRNGLTRRETLLCRGGK